jgi:ABC-type transport system involved in multi-copper enzyme maturation permease subunit
MNAQEILTSVLACSVLCLVQLLAAVPWLIVADPMAVRPSLRRPTTWLLGLVGVLGAGALLALFLALNQDHTRLQFWGRLFGGLLQLQLFVDFFVLVFWILLTFWPHGGAVALAAFREGVRQPLFWLIGGIALGWLVVSPFLPYFTFGEDVKVVRELGHDTIMLACVVFSVLAASMSISDEIEGRSAITVMSKPVSRRQFLIGKFLGILLAAMVMTAILGCAFAGVMRFKYWFDNELPSDRLYVQPIRDALAFMGETGSVFTIGVAAWFDWSFGAFPGLVLGFCQVMVLLAIAVALATRVPFVVNLVTCLVVFIVGHLTHVLVQVSSRGRYPLVSFVARIFEYVFPGLEYFDIGPVIAREIKPEFWDFTYYLGSVTLYALLYSIIALLVGLLLFEDRDLA